MRAKVEKKYLYLFGAYLFCVILGIAAFCAERNRLVFSEYMEKSIEPQTEVSVCEEIALHPGIYRVSLCYEMDTEELIDGFCFVNDDTVRAGGLLCIGIPLYDGLTETKGVFYLTDFTKSLRIDISAVNTTVRIREISIENTGKMWTVLLTVATFFFCLILGFMKFLDADRQGKIPQEKKIAGIVLAGIWLIASLPYFYHATISTGDGGYHMQRIEGVAASIVTGQIPVRLEPHWLQGYGYANGIFYCDFFFLFPAILRLLGFTVTTSYNLYCAVVNAATVAVSYYALKEIFKRQAVVLSTCALFSLSAVHFCTFTVIGRLGEGTAIIFIPLIFLGLYRIFGDDPGKKSYRRSFLPLALGFVGTISCHVLSSEIAAMIVLLWCFMNFSGLKKKEIWLELVKAVITAFSLCLWFIVPFVDFYFRQDIKIKQITTRQIQSMGLFFPQLILHFWGDGSGGIVSSDMLHAYSGGIGLLLMCGLLLFLILWFGKKLGTPALCRSRLMITGKKACILAAAFLVMSLRVFPWDAIQSVGGVVSVLISSLQFPIRLLNWGVFFAVLVFGCIMEYFSIQGKKNGVYAAGLLVIISVATSVCYLNDNYMNAMSTETFLSNAEGFGSGYISDGDYLIVGTDESQLHYGRFSAGEGVVLNGSKKGSLFAEAEVQNIGAEDSYLEFPLLYYTGYCGRTDTGEKIAVSSGENHVVRAAVPAGFSGTISVRFKSPFYWRIAELASLTGACLLIFWLNRLRRDSCGQVNLRSGEAAESVGNKSLSERTAGAFLFIVTVMLAFSPYLTGYVSQGTYILENLDKIDKLSGGSWREWLKDGGLFMLPAVLLRKGGLGLSGAYRMMVFLYLIAAYRLIRKALSQCLQKEQNGIPAADLGTMIYLLSPLVSYTLYNRTAFGDWMALLLLPPFVCSCICTVTGDTKIKDGLKTLLMGGGIAICLFGNMNLVKDVSLLSDPLKFPLLFQFFVHKGSYNYRLFLAHPLQLSPAYTVMLICFLYLLIRRKRAEKKILTAADRKVVFLLAAVLALWSAGCIPVGWNHIPESLIRIVSPFGLLTAANVGVGFCLVEFIRWIMEEEMEKKYKVYVVSLIILTIVGSAVFQLNDIALESTPLWI